MRYAPERSLFEDMFNEFGLNSTGLMRTDVHKKDGSYSLEVELPGYHKDDIKISLYNGELTIRAQHNESKEEKDAKGEVIHSERSYGAVTRTFYVGDHVKESDVHASYNNGILTVTVPSAEKKEAEEKKYIDIQ